MPRFHEQEELAPRDIVARAIDHEMKRLGLECVYLDISHRDSHFVKSHFPTVYARCLSLGIDITQEPVPVVPAAHYTCGGVVVDQHGASDLQGLYVIGETACTGLHGANRMASNSLLECFVYATAAAAHIAAQRPSSVQKSLPLWDDSLVRSSDENVVIKHNWRALRGLMWDYVGIVRSERRLQYARGTVKLMQDEINDFYRRFVISRPLLELRNLSQVAALMIDCALHRKESRGLHFNSDYPDTNSVAENTILVPANSPFKNTQARPLLKLPRYDSST